MGMNLANRMEGYENLSQIKLLPKLPIIIKVNGRGFQKITSLLEKPFDQEFSNCMLQTMNTLCIEIGGASFAYTYNDEIIIIARNDQSPDTESWYDNNVQKIISTVASIATLQFTNNCLISKLEISNSPSFIVNTFVVPNYVEAANYIINKQLQNLHTSVFFSCFYELINSYPKNKIRQALTGLSLEEKIDLLKSKRMINYHDYPYIFRFGASCYRVNKEIDGQIKNKWEVNKEVPLYVDNLTLLVNLIKGDC
jgi:tRNA(His) 5'-end guanylyltransferase